MKPDRFSSLSAFLEYYAALRRASHPTAEERATLAVIAEILEVLTPEERASLDGAASDAADAAQRRRERAYRKLARELIRRGVLEA